MPKSKSTKKPKTSRADDKAKATTPTKVSRKTTKRSQLVEMLATKTGTNIDAIVKATGWQPHTGRAMISGLRKAGYKIETSRSKDGKTVYRIVDAKKTSGKTDPKLARSRESAASQNPNTKKSPFRSMRFDH
jgi:hypothetical protein